LARHVETALNEAVETPADRVVASVDGTTISLATEQFGSNRSLQVLASSANTLIGFDTTEHTGVDVAGTINGQSATGTGQILQGVDGSSSEDLFLVVELDTPNSGIIFSARKGLSQILGERLKGLTDVDTGSIVGQENTLEKQITSLNDKISAADAMLATRRERYLSQFRAMESIMASLNSQADFLAGQIKSFENSAAAQSK
jgi:flagellar hook-associated protein 2